MLMVSIMLQSDAALSHISQRCRRRKLKTLVFDEAVECLLAVCRDCLENNLSETPPPHTHTHSTHPC